MVTLDFSKKRVRLNNKVLSKYQIADYFDIVQSATCWRQVYRSFSYAELASRFRAYVLNYRSRCELFLGDCISIEI